MNQDDSISRLVLGTAQLGMNYGIANRTGAPTKEEAFQILECAWEAGVRHFDTAPGYRSEPIIGEFVRAHNLGGTIQLLTKISSVEGKNDWKDSVLQSVDKSLEQLGANTLKVVFLHAQEDLKLLSGNSEFFEDLKVRFPIESLGVSVYDPETLMEKIEMSILLACQFPYNILDRRFDRVPIPKGKRYARSIFLQGLLASDQIQPNTPEPVRRLHHAIWTDSVALGLSPKEAAWTFANTSNCLDYFLVGVESKLQLRDLLKLKPVGMDAVQTLEKRWSEHSSCEWLDPRKWSK